MSLDLPSRGRLSACGSLCSGIIRVIEAEGVGIGQIRAMRWVALHQG